MANNRLYVGNKKTKEVYCISKAGEDGWKPIEKIEDLEGLNNVFNSDFIWNKKTDLVLFSESDTLWFNHFFNDK